MKTKTVSWFSAGVSSAVATKLAIEQINHIIYTHIEDQHPDTLRFVKDCEEWFGKPIEIISSPYKTVENVCKSVAFVNSRHGAPCTRILKRRVREEWEKEHEFFCWLTYIWGIDIEEKDRAVQLQENMPQQFHLFPLIEKSITKEKAHQILNASGIKRPAMYDLGYNNNNCIGCVKGGMGYWNHIRVDFPEVFEARAKMEREIGGTCIKNIYLDELEADRGRHAPPIVEDCGVFCEMMALKEMEVEK